MDLQLNGTQALATGSTVGIGLTKTRKLPAKDVSVIINRRKQPDEKHAAASWFFGLMEASPALYFNLNLYFI